MKQQLIDWLRRPENANKSVEQIIDKIESMPDQKSFLEGFFFGTMFTMIVAAIIISLAN